MDGHYLSPVKLPDKDFMLSHHPCYLWHRGEERKRDERYTYAYKSPGCR